MKHVTELIVAKNVDYDPATPTNGGLALLREDGSALVAGDTVADAPKIYIELILAATANRIRTALIEGVGIHSYKGQPWADPALQKLTIKVTTAPAVGTLLKLWIIFKSEKQVFQIRKAYEYKTLDTVVNTIAAAFRTLIQADTTLTGYIAESGATDSIVLTSVAPGDVNKNSTELDISAPYWDVSRNAEMETAAPVLGDVVVNPDPGHGTFNHIRILEWETKGYKGHLNRVQFADDPTFYSVSGTDYGQLIIDYDRSGDVDDGTKRRRPVSVTVASPKVWTGRAAFESILNGYMASLPGAFAAQTSG